MRFEGALEFEGVLEAEALKRLERIGQALERGLSGSDLDVVRLDLHTLKGDLAYLKNTKVMDALELLRKETESASIKKAIGHLKDVKKILSQSKFVGDDLEGKLRGLVSGISEKLGKKITLEIKNDWSERSVANDLFVLSVCSPLITNSCVHAFETEGTIFLEMTENGDWVDLTVSDDGNPGANEKQLNREEKLYSGQGIGLDQLKKVLSNKGGQCEVLEGGHLVKIKIAKKEALI